MKKRSKKKQKIDKGTWAIWTIFFLVVVLSIYRDMQKKTDDNYTNPYPLSREYRKAPPENKTHQSITPKKTLPWKEDKEDDSLRKLYDLNYPDAYFDADRYFDPYLNDGTSEYYQ